jgi:hypothetical protein
LAVTERVERSQVLAYRVAEQGLHRGAAAIAELAVLDLGVQEAMGQPAALAFAARLPPHADVSPGAIEYGPGSDLALTWTFRGAPHVHRRADLDAVAAALWPLSEPDAAARLNETGLSVKRAGIAAEEQFRLAVAGMRAAVTAPTGKGAVSTAVSSALPDVMLRDCRACKAKHLSDSAMRTATPAAGLEMEPGTNPPVLLRRPRARLPKRPDLDALAHLARRFLALLGPATVGDFAGYLEARRADVEQAVSGRLGDVVELDVDGRRTLLPADRLDALRSAPDPDPVRLLGPFDPYLQARDRALLVPDPAVQKVLWPVLGRPGAVLADGEVVGAWRTKTSGKALTITIEPFVPLPKGIWRELDAEADRVGQVRGATKVTVARKG